MTLNGLVNDANPTTTLSYASNSTPLSSSHTLPTGDTVNFNDQGDNTSGGFVYALTGTTLDRSGLPQTPPAITYSGLETVNLNTALRSSVVNVLSTAANVNTNVKGSINPTATGDTINVTSTGAGSNSTFIAGTGDTTFNLQTTGTGSFNQILGNGGNDIVNVSSNAIAGTRGNVDGINGTLLVDTGAGNNNRLTLDDLTGTSPNTNVVINSDVITGLAAGTIYYAATGGHFLDSTSSVYDGVTVRGADTHSNTFNIQSTLQSSSLTVEGGSHNDVYNVGTAANSLGLIKGNLTLNGLVNDANPTTTLSYASNSTPLSSSHTLPTGDTVNFNDQGDNTSGGFVYALTGTTLDRSGLPQTPPAITYSGLETVNLNTALRSSVVNVLSTAANVNTNVKGSINPTATGDTINVTSTGAGSNSTFIAGTGDTTFNLQTTGTGSFNQILGNAGNDVVHVSSNAIAGNPGDIDSINGTLNIDVGGGNFNRLFLDDSQGIVNANTIINSDNIVGFGKNLPTIFYNASNSGHFLDPVSTTANPAYDGILVTGSKFGGNTFSIQSSLGQSTTEVFANGINDTFNVSSDASRSSADQGDLFRGNNYGVQGILNLVAGGGTANRLVVSDYADTTIGHDVNIRVTNNLLHGFAAGDIYYSAINGGQFNTSTSSGILLKGSQTLANTFVVTSTFGVPNPTYANPAPATTTYEIDGGLSNDQFNIGDTLASNNGNLDLIQGQVTLVGNGGSDALEVNDAANKHTSNGQNAFNYRVTPTSVANDPTIVKTIPAPTTPPARNFATNGVIYNNDASSQKKQKNSITTLHLDGTDDRNIFTVTPSTLTNDTINGNLPVSGKPIPGGGDYLQLDTTHFADGIGGRTLHMGAEVSYSGVVTSTSLLGTGYWSFDPATGAQAVNFESIERFNHVAVIANVVSTPNTTPVIQVRDAETGDLKFTISAPYGKNYVGQVNVVAADVNFDGLPDIVTVNSASQVNIYNGSPNAAAKYTGSLLNTFNAFGRPFANSVSIAAGDINNDGAVDLVFGAGSGWYPQVRVYDGNTLLTSAPKLIGSPFNAFSSGFNGGVNVAVGYVAGNDAYADIVVTQATIGTAKGQALGVVNVFSGYAFTNNPNPQPIHVGSNPYTFSTGFNTSLSVAVGDYFGSGINNIIIGTGSGVPAKVLVYDLTNLTSPTVATWWAVTTKTSSGVNVSTTPVNGGNPGTIERVFIIGYLLDNRTFTVFTDNPDQKHPDIVPLKIGTIVRGKGH